MPEVADVFRRQLHHRLEYHAVAERGHRGIAQAHEGGHIRRALHGNVEHEQARPGDGLLGEAVEAQAGHVTAQRGGAAGLDRRHHLQFGQAEVTGPRGSAGGAVAYVHDFAPERQLFALIGSLLGAMFLVDGARPARDAAQVKAAGELLVGLRTAIFAKASQLYGGKGGIKMLF